MSGIAEFLVKKKPELIKEEDKFGRTALHYASYDRLEVVKLLIESYSSVAYIIDKDGRSALHYAAGNGHDDVTKEIIGRYPDAVDLVDHWKVPRLHLAVNRDSPDLVKYLLDKYKGRVDIDAMNKAHFTPLDLALSGKHDQQRKQVLFNFMYEQTKAAATFGRVNRIKERADRIKEHPDLIKKHVDLIKKHADLIKECTDLIRQVKEENPNLLLGVTPMGNTVFHLAAKVRDRDLVEEVYDDQCESLLAMTNSKGDTALHIAIRSGHLCIVNFLVEKSISASTSIDVEQGGNQTNYILGIQNHRNNTVLHEALR
ncbi:hypothetical protein HHK36_022043 [Tetracentron sinense]|uniref:Uncharacterized protein n=1 Tax=Tetracentron sinense TaxID=13715 RepID=A0A834YMG3_TETSI|nr:hypothetical protein HHK36_022043 [Tetracentron sinense]